MTVLLAWLGIDTLMPIRGGGTIDNLDNGDVPHGTVSMFTIQVQGTVSILTIPMNWHKVGYTFLR